MHRLNLRRSGTHEGLSQRSLCAPGGCRGDDDAVTGYSPSRAMSHMASGMGQGPKSPCPGARARVAITAVIRRKGDLRPIPWAYAALALGVLLCTSVFLAVVVAGVRLVGGWLPVLIACLTATIPRRTPAQMQGRVCTASELLAGVAQLPSVLGGALRSSWWTTRIPGSTERPSDVKVRGGRAATASLHASLYRAARYRRPAARDRPAAPGWPCPGQLGRVSEVMRVARG